MAMNTGMNTAARTNRNTALPRHRAGVGCASAKNSATAISGTRRAPVDLRAMAVEFPVVAGHPEWR